MFAVSTAMPFTVIWLVTTQRLVTQLCSGVHTTPQPPQFRGSLVLSFQTPPQRGPAVHSPSPSHTPGPSKPAHSRPNGSKDTSQQPVGDNPTFSTGRRY